MDLLLAINGFSETTSKAFHIVLIICAIFAGICIIVALFNDRINAIMCIILDITILIFLFSMFSKRKFYVDPATQDPEWASSVALIETILFYVLLVLRYLPCLRLSIEKNTYLILGTLVETTDSKIVGASVTFGIPLLYSIGFYFLSDLLLNNGIFISDIIGVGFSLVLSIIGLIRSFID